VQQTGERAYGIPCESGKSDPGEGGRSLALRLHKHRQSLSGLSRKINIKQHAYLEGEKVRWDGATILEVV
jgi:hypothetical protein